MSQKKAEAEVVRRAMQKPKSPLAAFNSILMGLMQIGKPVRKKRKAKINRKKLADELRAG